MILTTSCFKKEKTFILDLNSFSELNNHIKKNVCKQNSVFFHEDFIKFLKINSDHIQKKDMVDKIINNEKNLELIDIKFDFEKFDKNKNHTFQWGDLKGILDKNVLRENDNSFYVEFLIKSHQFFIEFRKSNNLFTGNIFSFLEKNSCIYPLIEKLN